MVMYRVQGLFCRCPQGKNMKRRLPFAVLLGCVLFMSSCGALFSQKIKGGLVGGLVASQVDGDRMGGYNKFGGHIGAFARTPIEKNLWFELQLLLIQKGSRPSGEGNLEGLVISTEYVDFEVSLLYNAWQSLFLKGGLVPGVCISGNVKTLSGVEQVSNVPFRKISLGVVMGAEYGFSKHMAVYMDFGYSILSIREGKIGVNNYRFAFQNGQFHNYMKLGIRYIL